MKKKGIIILCSVVAICAIGLVTSQFIDWPISFHEADGDIGKAARFSREQFSDKLTNMEELLQSDSAFRDDIVAAQVVMQTRAVQFGALVDMSNEAAGNIPAFAEVLKEMNANRELVDNVANSLAESAANLDTALGGEKCPDLAQSTINASLAYMTLQKQNNLATRFIDTTDKYLETAQSDDRLKFVRDQWVDYQKMTAALEGDKAAAEALAKKGNLLSGEKTLAAMADFGVVNQVIIFNSAYMQKNTGIDGSLSNALPEGALENVVTKISNAAGVYSNSQVTDAMNSQGVAKFNQTVIDALNEVAAVANNAQKVVNALVVSNAQKVGNAQVVSNAQVVGLNQVVKMLSNAGKVMEAYKAAMGSVATNPSLQARENGLSNRIVTIGSVIKETSMGNRVTMGLRSSQ
jgi:hypothetical protein